MSRRTASAVVGAMAAACSCRAEYYVQRSWMSRAGAWRPTLSWHILLREIYHALPSSVHPRPWISA
eukprot:354756-Pyramimonas_sp.AAC.1